MFLMGIATLQNEAGCAFVEKAPPRSLATAISLPCDHREDQVGRFTPACLRIALIFLLFISVGSLLAGGPEPQGWFPGDMHGHRSCGGPPEPISDIYNAMTKSDLNVLALLADMGNGEVQDQTSDLPLVNGENASISSPGRILHFDAEWHWDATYIQYPHQALGGHVAMLGLTNALPVWTEMSSTIFDWAHQQGAVAGFVHFQYLDDNIPGNLTCCTPMDYPSEVALGACDFISEDVNGGDAFLHAYYRLLNCGFRPGFAAGSDHPCGSSIGLMLTYAKCSGGQLTYRNWIEAIKLGRTVVCRNARAEFVDLSVNGTNGPGDEIKLSGPGTVNVTIRWTAVRPSTGTLELVQNGAIITDRLTTARPEAPVCISANVNFTRSGWLCARRMTRDGHAVHTAAVFVTVDGAPVRASSSDAQFYVAWMDTLLKNTAPGGVWASFYPTSGSAARARYTAARGIFERIAIEAGGSPHQFAPTFGNTADRWHRVGRLVSSGGLDPQH